MTDYRYRNSDDGRFMTAQQAKSLPKANWEKEKVEKPTPDPKKPKK